MGHDALAVSSRSPQELLDQFVRTGRQEPFEEIVRRYAGMVYHTCLQITRDSHDAEDATQAVFLTLAVKSRTTEPIRYLGPWLQQVAKRLSLDIKRSKKRREARETRRHAMNGNGNGNGHHLDPPPQIQIDELKRVLHDELQKLPAKYRLPLILHYFGGMKADEMAKELGCKPSTLGVRLYRGRKLLADNLAERGIVVGTALLGVAIYAVVHSIISGNLSPSQGQQEAGHGNGADLLSAAVSAKVLGLISATGRGMVLSRVKAIVALVLLASAVAGGATVIEQVTPITQQIDAQIQQWLRPMMRWLNQAYQSHFGQPLYAPHYAMGDSRDASQRWEFSPLGYLPGLDRSAQELFSIPPAPIGLPEAASAVPPRRDLLPPVRELPGYFIGSAAGAAPLQGVSPSTPFTRPATQIAADQALPQAPLSSSLVGDGLTLGANSAARTLVIDDSLPGVQPHARMDSGRLVVAELIVGQRGEGSFYHAGGRVEAERLVLGQQQGALGQYWLSGTGELHSRRQTIGSAGRGTFRQSGGVNRVSDTIVLGETRSGSGFYELTAGQLYAARLHVGLNGQGRFHQLGGTTFVGGEAGSSSDPGQVVIAHNDNSFGTYHMIDGELVTDSLDVGRAGEATLIQHGGTIRSNRVTLGSDDTSSAAAHLTGGDIELVKQSPGGTGAATSSFVIGDSGDAKVLLGTRRMGSSIAERPPDSGASMIVRANASADATLQGWGKPQITGPLTQNGRIIADAYGRKAALDFSSVQFVTNTIDNPEGGNYGWFARRGAELILPAMRIDGDSTHTWGENRKDRIIDLINSLRFSVAGVSEPGSARISLLAPDHADLPPVPQGESFIGFWSFDTDALFDQITLQIRYDDLLLGRMNLDEQFLRIWTFDGHWQPLEGNIVDQVYNLITATGESFSYFGVSSPSGFQMPLSVAIPEPSTIMLLTLGAGGLLLRRRRRTQ